MEKNKRKKNGFTFRTIYWKLFYFAFLCRPLHVWLLSSCSKVPIVQHRKQLYFHSDFGEEIHWWNQFHDSQTSWKSFCSLFGCCTHTVWACTDRVNFNGPHKIPTKIQEWILLIPFCGKEPFSNKICNKNLTFFSLSSHFFFFLVAGVGVFADVFTRSFLIVWFFNHFS